MKVSAAGENRVILHPTFSRCRSGADKAMSNPEANSSHERNSDWCEIKKWEKPSLFDYLCFRLDRYQECKDEQDEFRRFAAVLEGIPSGDWYARFSSPKHLERAEAYRENERNQAGETVIMAWWPLIPRVITLQSSLEITKFRMLLTHLFGDLSYEEIGREVARREIGLGQDRVKRHYVARILRDSYVQQHAASGSAHYDKERKVKHIAENVRKTYENIRICLDSRDVRIKLQFVSPKRFAVHMPKKISGARHPGAAGSSGISFARPAASEASISHAGDMAHARSEAMRPRTMAIRSFRTACTKFFRVTIESLWQNIRRAAEILWLLVVAR